MGLLTQYSKTLLSSAQLNMRRTAWTQIHFPLHKFKYITQINFCDHDCVIQCVHMIRAHQSQFPWKRFHKNPSEKQRNKQKTWIRLSIRFCSTMLPKVLPMTCSKGWMIFHYPLLRWQIPLQLFIIQSSEILKHLIRCTIFHQLSLNSSLKCN